MYIEIYNPWHNWKVLTYFNKSSLFLSTLFQPRSSDILVRSHAVHNPVLWKAQMSTDYTLFALSFLYWDRRPRQEQALGRVLYVLQRDNACGLDNMAIAL
jgi:hypothetical protein